MIARTLCTSLLLVSLACSSVAEAAQYRFVKIADSTQFSGDVHLYSPRLNDRGEVVFKVYNSGDTWLYKGNGGAVTQIAASGGRIQYILEHDFNSAGIVAYQARLYESLNLPDGTTVPRAGYFTSNGHTTSTLFLDNTNAYSNTPTVSFDNGPVINDRGQGIAVLINANKRTMIVDGQGRTLVTSPDSQTFYYSPSLNNNGVTAFVAGKVRTPGNQRAAIRTVTQAGKVRTVVDTETSEFLFLGAPQINDAGVIVFDAVLDSVTSGIFLADQSGTHAVCVDTDGVLGNFIGAGINNRGDIAFQTADPFGAFSAIYTGPDFVADRVIGTGDRLLGLRVDTVEFLGDINNAGQIAFSAVLGNGRQAIFRAEPIVR